MNISELAQQVLQKIRANRTEGQIELDRLWQDKEIVRQFSEYGYVLLWSNVVNDFVAYYDNEKEGTFEKIPTHYVPYSDAELKLMAEGDLSEENLRRIHMYKKLTSIQITGIEES